MNNPKPFCDKDCRFVYGYTTTTCMYYAPIYDKNGVNTNPDGNITSGRVKCTTCNTSWYSSTQYGKSTFTDITDTNVDI